MGSDHELGSPAGSETMGQAGSGRRCKLVAKCNTCSLHKFDCKSKAAGQRRNIVASKPVTVIVTA